MNDLKLPEQLSGPWDHALILTYGMDLPFFERTLWPQFAARCRNKIILADGQQYLKACAAYAEGMARSELPQVRLFNQHYLAEGIFSPHAAHAKLVLLTNAERGRLVVGSGNLNMQGYASGGELFTTYAYGPDARDDLAAFLAIREFLEGVISRNYLTPASVRRIQFLLEETPWLFHATLDVVEPVRHNLMVSFLDHLRQVVGGEPVEELWVLSPFYDHPAIALERVLTTFNPQRASLLIQKAATSADPTALQDVIDRWRPRCEIRAFTATNGAPYVHAKLYLLKLADRAICLQGSPNLSQVAMLLPDPRGNLEIANLFTGARDAFDHVFEALTLQSGSFETAPLQLRCEVSSSSVSSTDNFHLIGGEWYGTLLTLTFRGSLPELRDARLVIAGHQFPFTQERSAQHTLELSLTPDAAELLGRPVPVHLDWGTDETLRSSNPIFVCNRAALTAVLETSGESERLARISDLDLGDDELEQLLDDLNAALMLDRRSVWQIAGRPPPTTTEADDGQWLDYADVDYEQIRQHPKILQYLRGRGGGGHGVARTRLQVILSAITEHFGSLLDVSTRASSLSSTIVHLDQEDEESAEAVTSEVSQRRIAPDRIRRVLRSFVQRYLRGIQSSAFQEMAGYEVMGQNYVIFSHILWRLFPKDWVEPEFLTDTFLEIWRFFWGEGQSPGYIRQLPSEHQAEVMMWVRDYYADAEMIAASYTIAQLAQTPDWERRHFALRDFWRVQLSTPGFAVTVDMLEDAWILLAYRMPSASPSPSTIVDSLARLVSFETRKSFLRGLEQHYGYPAFSCHFDTAKVRRATRQQLVQVDCLVVTLPTALETADQAIAILRHWMHFEDRDYYRVVVPDANETRRLLIYEVAQDQGIYISKDTTSGEIEFGRTEPALTPVDMALEQMKATAVEVDSRVSIPRSVVPVQM
ncbi:MAG: hypothetical protein M3R24_16275 [Chloroflexota bacterium]|nr:hypothetical protein [Chloroflexota bacterium]